MSAIIGLLALSISVVSGALVALQPLLIAPVVALSVLICLGIVGSKVDGLFLYLVTVLVFGYSILGKGFAYWGIAPVYIGELVLCLGVGVFLFGRLRWKFSRIDVLLICFMLYGFVLTLSTVGEYGVDALRDAALWYYIAFAVLLSMMLQRDHIIRLVRVYGTFAGCLVLWILFVSMVVPLFVELIPAFPGSPVPLIHVKAGDRAVVLAGLAAFNIAGLDSFHQGIRLPSPVFWGAWLIAALMVAIESRAAFLGLSAAMLLLILMRPSREWVRLATVVLCVAVPLLILNPTIDLGRNRVVSTDQFVANIVSIFPGTTDTAESLRGTRDWRLEIWREIYDSTVHGPQFWTGKGFGVNILAAYGFAPDSDFSVRSPHNTNVTVLARMGVPGALLWIVFQTSFLVSMIRFITRTHKQFYGRVALWLLAFWTTAIVNTSFETALEGPHGAIPFWCVFGVGLALMKLEQIENGERSEGRGIES